MKLIFAALAAFIVACPIVSVSLSACSSDDSSNSEPEETGDAGTKTDTGTPKTDSSVVTDTGTPPKDALPPGVCNTLVNNATEATQSTVKANPPTAIGGTIADGTYYLSEFNLYDPTGTAEGPSPSGMKVTLSIKGTAMDSIQTLPDDSSQTFAETFVVAGNALNRTLSCPKTGPDLAAVYSVAGNKLTIYETDPNSNVAGSVYTKQ